jgi:hypothetical protein
MNARIVAFMIFLVAFLLAIASVASIPQDLWSSMPTYEGAIIAFNLLTGLAAVLVAYWIHADYERLRARFRILCRQYADNKGCSLFLETSLWNI